MKDKSILTLQSIPENYKINDYVPKNESVPLLPIGTIAPDWQLVSLTDEKLSLKDFKGKLVLLDFFYKSCYPCVLALPKVQAIHDRYKNKGLQVIGINPQDKNEDSLAEFLSKRGITYPVLLEAENVARNYNVKGYPTFYLIDKDGKIIYTHLGLLNNLENLEDFIVKNL